MNSRALLLASTALFPWAHLATLAFGVGTLWVAFALVRDYGAIPTHPSRCPACRRDGLMRIDAGIKPSILQLLQCRSCGEAFRLAGRTLYRDTGGPLL